MSPATVRLVGSVLRTELRGLLRDRRAFFMAVAVPMLLFPVMLFGMGKLGRASEESLGERRVRVALDLRALGPELAWRARTRLADTELRITPADVETDAFAQVDGADPEGWRAAAEALLADEHDLAVVAVRDAEADAVRLLLLYDGSESLANEARRRVAEVLRELDREVRRERLEGLLGGDPADTLAAESRDMAPAEDAVGHELGQLLPIVLVLMLISGGSFAALGVFAGEREAGTIETLLVQPVPAMALATGKFLAVLATACAALAGNSASFLLCLSIGWGDTARLAAEAPLGANLVRLAAGLALFLPTAVLLSAVLCLLSARARSFREGQHYVFPLVLIASVLALVSTQDRVASSALLALVPVTGATLVLRDTLSGSFPPVAGAVSFGASAGWAWLVLRRLAQTLDAERLFRTQDSASELAARRVQSRRALAWGVTAVAVIYIVGGRMQTASPVLGLTVTLWVLVPTVALLAARGTARRAGEPLGRVLGLGAPHPAHALGAILIAPGLAVCVTQFFAWQNRILPLPSSASELELFEPFARLAPWTLVLLMAVSPGWNEELLFRGAILSGLKRDLSPAKVVLWQALLFGAVHASLHRFLPTAIVGAVLAAMTLRSGRLWPAVCLHASYNALLVLEVPEASWWRPGVALGVAGVGGLLFLVRPRAD